MQKLPPTLFSIGCAILFICIPFWIVIPSAIHNAIVKEMSLQNGTIFWEEWTKTKNDTTILYVYIFNVTNPKEIENGEDPLIIEVGPYVYREKRFKQIVEQNVENDTLKYIDTVTYHFDESLSQGTEDDVVMTLNVPFVTAAQHLTEFSATYRWIASMYLSKFQESVFVERPVREFLFEGTFQPMTNEIKKLIGLNFFPNSTFGLLYGRNETELGLREIYSGIKDPAKLGETVTFNGEAELRFWKDKKCNMINGTDGTLFSPYRKKEERLYVYNPKLCRSEYFTYKEELEVKGVPAYRYTSSPKLMESPEHNPDNDCFCTVRNKCPKSGAYQVGTCKQTAPILLSNPHFLYGDEEYIAKFGFQPKIDNHQSSYDLEPTTGIPLEVHHRVQMNVDVRRLPNKYKFKRIQDMLFPLIWTDEHYIIREENSERLRLGLINPLAVIQAANVFALSCSLLLIFTSLTVFCIRIKRKPVFV